MKSCRPPLFWKRKFEPQVIVTCVRWYLRFCLSFRDLEELMAERGLAIDHTTIWRWTQTYGPGGPPAAARRGEAEILYLAHGRDLCSDRWQMDVPERPTAAAGMCGFW